MCYTPSLERFRSERLTSFARSAGLPYQSLGLYAAPSVGHNRSGRLKELTLFLLGRSQSFAAISFEPENRSEQREFLSFPLPLSMFLAGGGGTVS